MATSFSSRRRSASAALKKKQKHTGTPFVADEGPDSYTTPVPPSPHRRVGSATPKRKRKRGAQSEEHKCPDNPAIPSTSSCRGRSDPTFPRRNPTPATSPQLGDAPTLNNPGVQAERDAPIPQAGTFNHPIYLCDPSDDEEFVRTQNNRPPRPIPTVVDNSPSQQADKPPCASCLDHLALWEGTSADPVPLCTYGESTDAKCLRCESLSPQHECLLPGRRVMATAKAMVEAAKAIDSDSTYLAFHNAQTRYLRAKERAAGEKSQAPASATNSRRNQTREPEGRPPPTAQGDRLQIREFEARARAHDAEIEAEARKRASQAEAFAAEQDAKATIREWNLRLLRAEQETKAKIQECNIRAAAAIEDAKDRIRQRECRALDIEEEKVDVLKRLAASAEVIAGHIAFFAATNPGYPSKRNQQRGGARARNQ